MYLGNVTRALDIFWRAKSYSFVVLANHHLFHYRFETACNGWGCKGRMKRKRYQRGEKSKLDTQNPKPFRAILQQRNAQRNASVSRTPFYALFNLFNPHHCRPGPARGG